MTPTSKSSKATLVLTVGLLVVFAFIFLIMFVLSTTGIGDAPAAITETTYLSEVENALISSDASAGETLVEVYTCNVCHLMGDGTIAPLFMGIANVAGERRPPLGAEQYLYESIVHPGVYVLPGYTNSMPNNYGDLLTEQEIGHIIKYLMTLDEVPEA